MLSPNVRELTFAVGQDFGFEPGQWVNLFFPEFRNAQGNPLKRAYSIASAPRNDGTFELAVTRVTDGPIRRILVEELGVGRKLVHIERYD
jgi:ferredoxin-NADP reductase